MEHLGGPRPSKVGGLCPPTPSGTCMFALTSDFFDLLPLEICVSACFLFQGRPVPSSSKQIPSSPGAGGGPSRRGCSDARGYKRSSRIQKKLTNTEEAHEHRRSSRVQEKLTNTAEAPRSEQKPPGPSTSPLLKRTFFSKIL